MLKKKVGRNLWFSDLGGLGSAEKFSILGRRSVSVKKAFLSGILIPGSEEEGVEKYFRVFRVTRRRSLSLC